MHAGEPATTYLVVTGARPHTVAPFRGTTSRNSVGRATLTVAPAPGARAKARGCPWATPSWNEIDASPPVLDATRKDAASCRRSTMTGARERVSTVMQPDAGLLTRPLGTVTSSAMSSGYGDAAPIDISTYSRALSTSACDTSRAGSSPLRSRRPMVVVDGSFR